MFCIRIAGLDIQINNHYPYVETMCTDYIVPSGGRADMCIEVTHDDIEKEQKEAEYPYPEEYCESICIYRAISEQLIEFDAFLMHGACIEYEDRAYVFLAKSGTGKSTHIALWKKVYGDGVHIINGDKPVVRCKDGTFYVYGTPWCGKEGWNVNTCAALKALCFLERGEDNCISEMEDSLVMSRLCHQILMPKSRNNVIRYLAMMDKLIRNTGCYIMQCNMDEEAARVACEGMK